MIRGATTTTRPGDLVVSTLLSCLEVVPMMGMDDSDSDRRDC